MIHESLENYYRLNVKLNMKFGHDFDTLENMFPFEREIYYAIIIEELEKKAREQNGPT